MGAGSSKSTLSSDLSLDPLPYLTADLPQHIVENKLPPGSGRLFKTFRIRSREGASFVCKVAILKYSAASVSLGGAMVRNLSRASSLSAAGSTSEGRVVTSTQHRDLESESRNSETASTAVATSMQSGATGQNQVNSKHLLKSSLLKDLQ